MFLKEPQSQRFFPSAQKKKKKNENITAPKSQAGEGKARQRLAAKR